jgi:RNA polymerase sigma factor (sigma-70 family)
VRPEDDFREQETIEILAFARAAMLERRPALTTGLRKPELRKWITELTIALDEYRVLRDEMLEANVRLVTMLARQYRHPTLSFLDFVQEGTLGLIRAIEKYEPSRKVKFSTYAVWWIWQQIARSADNQGALIRTPVHWNQMRREVGRRSRSGDIGEAHAELAHHRGMDQDRIATMAQTFRFVSTDQPASDDDERPLETLVADEQETPDARVLQADLRELVAEAVAQLPPREAEILYQRFGLRDDCARTLDEIGTHFGVSRERIRQLESRALRQLKEVCRARGLDAYLN